MTTSCIAVVPAANVVVAASPWWQRAFELFPGFRVSRLNSSAAMPSPASSPAATESDYEALAELSPAILRDIGAPEWLRDRAELSRRLTNQPLLW